MLLERGNSSGACKEGTGVRTAATALIAWVLLAVSGPAFAVCEPNSAPLEPVSVEGASTTSSTGQSMSADAKPVSAQVICNPPEPPPDPPPPPLRDAQFIGQSVPTTMVAGQSYAVSVQMKNTGTATWTVADGYKLGSQNPGNNTLWGLNRVGVSGSVAPGQIATFNFTARAPSSGGTYNFQWRMVDEGEAWFGASTTNVAVTVLSGWISASPNPCTIPFGSTTCTSTISWGSSAANAQVVIAATGQVFANGQNGSQAAPWIGTSTTRFELKSGGTKIASVDVKGNAASTPTGSISTSPNPCPLYDSWQTACYMTVGWSSSDPTAQAWYTFEKVVNGETQLGQTLLGSGTSGSKQVLIGNGTFNDAFKLKVNGVVIASRAAFTQWAPKVLITAPSNGQVFHLPANITVGTTPTDQDGTISKVELVLGANPPIVKTASPYSYTWSNVAAGTYTLKAKAYDNYNAPSREATVQVRVNALPTVQWQVPAAGASYTAPATIELAATAADSDGTIKRVEFWNGATKLTDVLAPTNGAYRFTWSNVPGKTGTYEIKVRAVDNDDDASAFVSRAITVNALPSAQWQAPAAGASYIAPATIELAATAADGDGTIKRVEFWNGATKLTDVTTPTNGAYRFTWSNVPGKTGAYDLRVRAVDNRDSASAFVTRTVTVNALPTAQWVAPAAGAKTLAPATIELVATAADGDGTVKRVEFWNGAIKLTDVTAPANGEYRFTWSNVPGKAGTYEIKVRAVDDRNGTGAFATRNIEVNAPPSIDLTAPADGASYTPPPATIALAATASDGDGSIAKVEFFKNGSKIGETSTLTSGAYRFTWNNVPVGDYALTAKATDDRGATATTANGRTVKVREPWDVADAPVTSLAAELPAHDPTVGVTAGQAGTSGGAASYEIPIAVPPGRRGMQPALSLSYSSRAGNGLAGMGWSLSGLSSIHRCPQTLEQDGAIRPVQLDANDRLCLDGQRLVATSGVYGASGTTYATELDSFARITQLGGNLASGASHFKVELKSGEIVFYGGNTTAANAARVVPGGVSVPLSWLIERRQDRVGNFVRYAYSNYGNGEVLVASILYTGFASADGNRQVSFTYEPRPTTGGANDQSSSYLAGGLTRQTQRLKQVNTYVGTEKVREYGLTYTVSAASGRSLLGSVSDCAWEGTTRHCKPATRFTWQSQAATYRFKRLSLTGAGLSDADSSRTLSLTPAADFNGDGARDAYWLARGVSNPNAREGYVLTLTPERTVSAAIAVPSELLGQMSVSADFDLDGRADIVTRDSTNTLVVRFWHGPMTATSFAQAFPTTWNTGIVSDPSQSPLVHVGDMDADGRADLVLLREIAGNNDSCRRQIEIYLSRPSASGPAAPASFQKLAQTPCLTGHTEYNSGTGQITWDGWLEKIETITDLDGDGLPEIFIRGHGYNGYINVDRFYSGCRGSACGVAGGYGLVSAGIDQLFPASDPRHSIGTGGLKESGVPDIDVNGDGLGDLLAGCSGDIASGYTGVRLNTGQGFGACLALQNPITTTYAATRSRRQVADIDGDGRAERLIARRFAARYCAYERPTCPNPDDCREKYWCPEDPQTGQVGFTQAVFDGSDGVPIPVGPMYSNGKGVIDSSAYYLNALRVIETGPGQYRLDEVPTDIVDGIAAALGEDLFGDGLADGLTRVDCMVSGSGECGVPLQDQDFNPLPLPRLPGGYGPLAAGFFLNENAGPAGVPNPNGLTPQTPDLLAMVTDGLGNETVWTYYPLSSQAGRVAGETPLYTVPADTAARYLDDRHLYFTSSMPVVAEMSQSDGVGGERSWRYGYAEAIYHQYGRGFAGFRTVIEEDEAAGLRTTTTFHQKFPLTGQVEAVVVNALSRPGTSAPLKVERSTWRCNRANRSDTACPITPGTATVQAPYRDQTETWTYDPTVALAASGTPVELGYTAEVNAADGRCAAAGGEGTASGYDAVGNLTQRTVLAEDRGSGGNGFRRFVSRSCQVTAATFAPDPAAWWLDKLTAQTATTSVAFDATTHALPTGTANPTQTVTTTYAWNPDRTLATETVQPGVANQQRVTAYAYPATPNYGLPTGVAISAAGDPHGTRSAGTAYSADGYFPRVVTDPLGHAVRTETRARDGQPALTVDSNGLRTLFTYDAFGAAITTRFRGQTDAEQRAPDQHTSLVWCQGTCEPGASALYKRTDVQDGAPVRITAFDQQGRTLLTATRQLDGELTRSRVDYDALGRVSRQSEPYPAGGALYWTTFAYDALGRVTQKTVPQAASDGRGDRRTRYLYSGRETLIEVCGTADVGTANCLAMSRTTDSLGRVVETVDAEGGTTRYWQDAPGNTLALQDANGVLTRAAYNALGQRTSVNDPNQGPWSFAYNALGELLTQTDARGIATTFAYDPLGRSTQRRATVDVTGDGVAEAVVDSWAFDPINGVGRPASSQRTVAGQLERRTATTYDALARPIRTDTTQRLSTDYSPAGTTTSYAQHWAYDGYYGRVKGQGFPNREAVAFTYSKYGHVIKETDPVRGTVYRTATAVSPRGQVTSETLGGTWTSTWSYAARTGQLTGVNHVSATAQRQLSYTYDVYGNLRQQQLNAGSSTETYAYDDLHRLTQATRTGGATGTVAYGYDPVGNLTKKTDFSVDALNAYGYTGACGGGPNAVKAVQLATGTRNYCYDANGNLTGDNAGLAVAYDHANLPIKTVRGTATLQFAYGPDGQRTRQWGSGGTRIYLSGYEDLPSTGETKVYVGDYAVVTNQPSTSTRTVRYLLKDRLGSVDAVGSETGALVETRGYDAFGQPRSGTWANLSPARLQTAAVTPKGFTQHEHLDSVELIHMNGRAYDYQLGRFLSVDPVIQFPLNSQSLNPYSYILNNPLSGTDPTGYAAKCGDEIADGDVCEVEVKQRVKAEGSNITRVVTKTFTVANNGGAIFAAEGTGAKAFAAINAAQIGAASSRSNGPVVGPVPKRVGERGPNFASCAKVGTGCESEAFLYDPNEPSGLTNAVGDALGAWRARFSDGGDAGATNAFTGQPIAGGAANARTDAIMTVVSLGVAPGTLPLRAEVAALRSAGRAGTEVVQRAMSRAELRAMQETGLIRGGRAGTHFVSDAVNADAVRARIRLALPQTPEVRVTMEVPAGRFSAPTKAEPKFNMPGGGTQRMATGDVPVRIIKVDEM